MSLSNPWFIAALIGVLGVFHLEFFATLLNLARLSRPVPPSLAEVFPEETREKLVDYIRDSKKVSFTREVTLLGILIVFWWSGGFGWLQTWAESQGKGPVITGVVVLAISMLAQTWISLPFDAWDTFGVESRHGFNKTTLGTFITDHFKGLALMALLGLPVAAALVWFFQTQTWAALYAWLFLAGFILLMTWLSPRVIMPVFLKFQPMEDGELKDAIFALAQKLDFPVAEVSVVDGSRRSTKANAFFAGFGKTRRIALYDTLLKSHTTEEIVAILAHEIGHNKCRHVPTMLILNLLEMALMLGLLGWALKSPGFFAAFGVSGTPVGMGLVLFGMIYKPLGVLTGLLGLAMSRKHEFEADAYARKAVGSHQPLTDGLKKLSRDHLAHPEPHPLTVWLHYSHPPLVERLAALQR
ncbi:M48 family metallopeptidase [Prosthecobacter dejongeii]|uniref:STE24 endopeptidase n=1 Tax=Prosthecobacter dejongeii TaxID=48465 RepID=A0A7W7YP08_9BACT|nr:M48 family metallopeptidase [Prosthecobacter dejongeii]MBB5039706.1 STE24 endopeptidase [Prosthecobacter dejongeii]